MSLVVEGRSRCIRRNPGNLFVAFVVSFETRRHRWWFRWRKHLGTFKGRGWQPSQARFRQRSFPFVACIFSIEARRQSRRFCRWKHLGTFEGREWLTRCHRRCFIFADLVVASFVSVEKWRQRWLCLWPLLRPVNVQGRRSGPAMFLPLLGVLSSVGWILVLPWSCGVC